MDWSAHLEPGEKLCWEGRPAPRCYVFRHWRRSFFGILLLLLSVWWQLISYQEGRLYGWPWLTWLPLPVLLVALYTSVGHLIFSRLHWEHLYYALTDRRILIVHGLLRRQISSMPLAELTSFQFRPLGAQLGSFRLLAGNSGLGLQLCCLEHPQLLADRLETVLVANGQEVPIVRRPF